MAADAFDRITGDGEFADADGAVARHPPPDLERRRVSLANAIGDPAASPTEGGRVRTQASRVCTAQPRAAGRMTSEAGCRPVPARHKVRFRWGGSRLRRAQPEASHEPQRGGPKVPQTPGVGRPSDRSVGGLAKRCGRKPQPRVGIPGNRPPGRLSSCRHEFLLLSQSGRANRDLPKLAILHQRAPTSLGHEALSDVDGPGSTISSTCWAGGTKKRQTHDIQNGARPLEGTSSSSSRISAVTQSASSAEAFVLPACCTGMSAGRARPAARTVAVAPRRCNMYVDITSRVLLPSGCGHTQEGRKPKPRTPAREARAEQGG